MVKAARAHGYMTWLLTIIRSHGSRRYDAASATNNKHRQGCKLSRRHSRRYHGTAATNGVVRGYWTLHKRRVAVLNLSRGRSPPCWVSRACIQIRGLESQRESPILGKRRALSLTIPFE